MGVAGTGGARATLSCSLPSLLDFKALHSQGQGSCAMQLLCQVMLVIERWPQTPVTSPEGAGCAHKQEAAWLSEFCCVTSLIYLCYFFSVSFHEVFHLYFQVQSQEINEGASFNIKWTVVGRL